MNNFSKPNSDPKTAFEGQLSAKIPKKGPKKPISGRFSPYFMLKTGKKHLFLPPFWCTFRCTYTNSQCTQNRYITLVYNRLYFTIFKISAKFRSQPPKFCIKNPSKPNFDQKTGFKGQISAKILRKGGKPPISRYSSIYHTQKIGKKYLFLPLSGVQSGVHRPFFYCVHWKRCNILYFFILHVCNSLNLRIKNL